MVDLRYFEQDVADAYRFMQLEAYQMHHVEADSDHAVLGLVRQRNGPAAQTLAGLGLTFDKLDDLRLQVRELRPWRGNEIPMDPERVVPSADLAEVFNLALQVVQQLHPADRYSIQANTTHFLFALAIEVTPTRPGQTILIANCLNLITLQAQVLPELTRFR